MLDNNNLRGFAINNRKKMTDAERKLWYKLRSSQNIGKWRRQNIIGNYIVDFVNLKNKLIIECDGEQHGLVPRLKQDATRTKFLNDNGYKILRFWNGEILKDIDNVMFVIYETINHPSQDFVELRCAR